MKTTSLEQSLHEDPFFGAFEPNHLALIAGCGQNEHADAGAFLFREGGPAERFYLVRNGRVMLEVFPRPRGAGGRYRGGW